MFLIAQVILTIVAWIRGWKGYALIPLAIAVTIGFGGGYILAASGGQGVK